MITNVLDTIGVELYKFLQPKDLFSLSLTNRHIYNGISKGVIQACLLQLPSKLNDQSSNESDAICYQVLIGDHVIDPSATDIRSTIKKRYLIIYYKTK